VNLISLVKNLLWEQLMKIFIKVLPSIKKLLKSWIMLEILGLLNSMINTKECHYLNWMKEPVTPIELATLKMLLFKENLLPKVKTILELTLVPMKLTMLLIYQNNSLGKTNLHLFKNKVIVEVVISLPLFKCFKLDSKFITMMILSYLYNM